MSFGEPLWLFALLSLPVLAVLYVRNEARARRVLQRVVAARLAPQLAGNVSYLGRRVRFALLLVALGLLFVTMAKPRYGYTWQEATRKGRDVIIAIDTSRSMLATDLVPNRLMRAKLAAQDLIAQLEGDRVGLIAFAGSAFLQAPLTADYGAVNDALRELDTDIIPRGGTNIADAIETAAEAFGKGESDNRGLIIFTDGEELDEDAMRAADKVAGDIRVFTVGVGSEEGSVIPVPDERGGTAFVKDEMGEIVKSRLNEELLGSLARAGRGFYLRLSNGPADMRRIVERGLGGMEETEIDARTSRRPIERYQWPLAGAMAAIVAALFVTDRKRRVRAAVWAAALILSGTGAQAEDGRGQYEKGDYEAAYGAFNEQLKWKPDSPGLHYGLGAAAYKMGRYDEALGAFSKALTTENPDLRAKSEYNLGNTLFRRGQAREERERKIEEWKSALQHYDAALEVSPDYADAEHNRDLVAKLIEELEKEQEEEGEEEEEEEQQEGEQQEGEQQEGEQQEGEQQEGEQQEGEQQEGEQQEGEQQEGEQQEGEQQEGEQQEGEQQEGQDGQPQERDEQKGRQEEAGDLPPQEQRDLEGELQAEGEPSDAGEEEMPVAVEQGEDGEMSEAQAEALLRSLQGDEARVPLNERAPAGRVIKDW